MDSDLILVIVVGAALVFDFTNGFNDTANVMSTAFSTRAAAPKVAIAFVSALNFLGAFLSIEVAATVARDVVNPEAIEGSLNIVFGGLIGAIAWNLTTWYLGLPSSSSHALIGGLVGSAFAAQGADAILGAGLVGKVLVPALIAPLLAVLVAGASIGLIYRVVGKLRPGPVTNGFRLGQVFSGGLLALAHGANDAQKTMGVITLALIANGSLGPNADPPFWVIASAAGSIALGTYSGGWRIIRTTGARILKMDAPQGFAAQGAGAAVILTSTHFGFPLSTTHVINGGVVGAGAGRRFSAARWGVAGNTVVAWVLTMPAAAGLGAAAYGLTRAFGTGAAGPIVVTVIALGLAILAFVRRSHRGSVEPAS